MAFWKSPAAVRVGAMVVCSTCGEDLAKTDFSAAQLKKNASQRSCLTCVAAMHLTQAVIDNPPPLEVAQEAAQKMEEAASASYGYTVEDRPGVGRVLVTTRAFEPGEIVLREKPALDWGDDASSLLTGFLAAESETQAAILEMATPSQASDLDLVAKRERDDIVAARRQRHESRSAIAAILAAEYTGSARIAELIETLLLIADSNAHAFEGRVGLFPLAALANHSCEPSCGHGTSMGAEMRFWANRALTEGEEITISCEPPAACRLPPLHTSPPSVPTAVPAIYLAVCAAALARAAECASVCVCSCVRVCACARVRVCVCACACVRARAHACTCACGRRRVDHLGYGE